MSEFKVGDKFEIVKSPYVGDDLKVGSIVEFVRHSDDDEEVVYLKPKGNDYPKGLYFCIGDKDCHSYARPLKTEAEKRGAKFGVGGVIKVTRSKWVFACEIEGFWRGIAENGVVVSAEPHHLRLDHEPEYREIPFSEATHEQRMDVSALRFDGGPVEQIVQFDNGAYAFTTSDCDYACPITDHLTVRIPS